MILSDLAVKRPVLAVVASLIIVVVGALAFTRLPLREIPSIDPPVVSVQTSYPGANASVIEARITQPLEDAIAGIEGIALLQSSSQNGRSNINIEFTLDRDIESAANDVRDAVSRNVGGLPEAALAPTVEKADADAEVVMWLNLEAPAMDPLALTDFAERQIVDRLSSIDGVANVIVGGGQRYAMRIWLKRDELAARGLTVADVAAALRRENVELPAGRLESAERDFILRLSRSYRGETDFETLPIAQRDGRVVTLAEVADVELASAEVRSQFRGNGSRQLGLGLVKTSTSNSLDVAKAARAEMDAINKTVPKGVRLLVAFDTTIFIDAALTEVYKTLAEATIFVVLVIWWFIGSWRAALTPAVTLPVCILGACIALAAFGFSINLLTLLALVLSIGLVVDDAIVVLENCQRRVDLGEPRLVAAYRGARQVAFAVIATTAVLVAVFLPIAFMQGNLGRLFRELSVAIASAVAISAFVALTLSPMMCSKLLVPHDAERGLSRRVDNAMNALSARYGRALGHALGHPWVVVIVMLVALGVVGLLVWTLPKELTPSEDRGALFVQVQGPEGAGFSYMLPRMAEVEKRLMTLVDDGSGEDRPVARMNIRTPRGMGGASSEEMHTGQATLLLKQWADRAESTDEVAQRANALLAGIPGVRASAQARSGLVRSFGPPVQLVLQGPTYEDLTAWRDRVLLRMEENPKLVSPDSDYKDTRPQMRVEVDRARAAQLGVSVEEIGAALDTLMAGRRVTTFQREGEEYDVLLQAQRDDRRDPVDLTSLRVRSQTSGELVALSNLVSFTELAEPGSLNRFNRQRAITVSANLAPGYSLGEAITWLEDVARAEMPGTSNPIDWKGEAREYLKTGSSVVFTMVLALLVVFLVLAAQFESFVHPLTIMLSVPLAVLGALLGLAVYGESLNIYSQIGVVMLVGLAAKNGILIVEFANQLRDAGRDIRAAILESATTRLRPILMTSIATMVGALPLLFASGAGAASRQAIGVTVVFGLMLSTLLSLFVVPVVYLRLARRSGSPEAVARALDLELTAHPLTESNH